MSELTEFDFDLHKQRAVDEYGKIQGKYELYSKMIKNILSSCIKSRSIQIHSIESRAKTVESFGEKVKRASKDNSNVPKYINPLEQITDLAGVRIITFFPRTILEIDKLIHDEFDVLEKLEKGSALELGYKSVHYLVKLNGGRNALTEYSSFTGMIVEIQVRTILQHAWAEIEHDIQYKSATIIPSSIRARFMSLAGLLEIADREFQSIQDEDEKLRLEARIKVQDGNFDLVEITPDALKTYLDKTLGSDGRISDESYAFEAHFLKRMGFTYIRDLDECIQGLDDDEISRVMWGTRQGPLTRLQDVLLAAMGNNYINRHPWGKISNGEFWIEVWNNKLDRLRAHGMEVGNRDITDRSENNI